MSPNRAGWRGPSIVLGGLFLLASLGIGGPTVTLAPGGLSAPALVGVRPGADVGAVLRSVANKLGIHATLRFDHAAHGFAAPLTQAQAMALRADPRIESVSADASVHAAVTQIQQGYPSTSNEVQPGVRRIGATDNPDFGGGDLNADIAILDLGIQKDNPELNVVGGYDCTGNESDSARTNSAYWNDTSSFGHGTHVAGIAAARYNGRGVAGVAPGARLWAIKVLNAQGDGFWSWVICGLDHVASMNDPNDSSKPRIEVVNMSLYGGGTSDGNCGHDNGDLLHQAICRVVNAGITVVAAAGNVSDNSSNYIPAAYDEVITVSAMADFDGKPGGNGSPPSGCFSAGGVHISHASDDAFGSFSDYGRKVDVIAPGVCVLSTLPTNRLGRMTGTSMATPHGAGAAALYYPWEQEHGHGRPSPLEVKAALVARGVVDWRTSTDPDSTHEPTLNVSDFNLAADFAVDTSPQVALVHAGDTADVNVKLARIGGFGSSINLSASGLPAGGSASFSPDPASGGSSSMTIHVPGSAAPGGYDIHVTGSGGGRTNSALMRLIVVAGADAGGPSIETRAGIRTGVFSLPLRVDWDAVSGASKYNLEVSANGDAWKSVATTSGTTVNVILWPGRRYQYRVRAHSGGTWHSWLYGGSDAVIPLAATDGLQLSGGWFNDAISSSYDEFVKYATSNSASAKLNFSGRSIAWIANRGPSRGRADVYLDGSFVATVDLYSSSNSSRNVVFARSWSSEGNHTLLIDVLGQPSTHARVDIDTLIVVAN